MFTITDRDGNWFCIKIKQGYRGEQTQRELYDHRFFGHKVLSLYYYKGSLVDVIY